MVRKVVLQSSTTVVKVVKKPIGTGHKIMALFLPWPSLMLLPATSTMLHLLRMYFPSGFSSLLAGVEGAVVYLLRFCTDISCPA